MKIKNPDGFELLIKKFDAQSNNWVALNKKSDAQKPSPPDGPILNVATWCAGSNIAVGTNFEKGIMSITKHKIVVDVTKINLRYVVTKGFGGSGVAAKLRVAVKNARGILRYVTFNNQDHYDMHAPIDGIQIIVSDDVFLDVFSGEEIVIYSWLKPLGTSTDIQSDLTGLRAGDYIGYGEFADTMKSTTYTRSRWSFRPTQVLAPSDKTSWLATGDSIVQQEESFLELAPNNLNLATSKSAQGGDSYMYHTRLEYSNRYHPYLEHTTHLLDEFSINERGNHDNWKGIAINAITIWKKIHSANPSIKIVKTTMTLYTGSVDRFSSIEGQRVDTGEKGFNNRSGFNDWLRDGAPVDSSGIPLDVGTKGAIRCSFVTNDGRVISGSDKHPLWFVSDVVNSIESEVNSGLYSIESLKESDVYGKGQDGLHPAPGIHAILARRLSRDIDTMMSK